MLLAVAESAARFQHLTDDMMPAPEDMDDATLLATLANVAAAIERGRAATDRLMDYRDDLYLAGRQRKARIKVNTLAETAGMTVGSVSVAIHRAEARAR